MRRYGWLLALALPAVARAQTPTPQPGAEWIAQRYTKIERRIPMRDGVELFTSIHLPKASDAPHPILLKRTPYSCAPYGEAKLPDSLGPGVRFLERDYIVVHQDVRGCWMSGGEFVNVRPQRAAAPGAPIDESTDTWDTVEWLVKNVPGNNGRVGLWGVSYPGFYAAVGMIDAHPALQASSPQAPIADWYFDDFFHHGAFFLPHALLFFNGFGVPRAGPTSERSGRAVPIDAKDGYAFFLELGPLANVEERLFQGRVPFWTELTSHPNYDAWWQARNLLPQLRKVAPAVLTVGGWFDAEDLYGPLRIYRALEELDPGVKSSLVMGPWVHGGWARTEGDFLDDARFGSDTARWYRDEVELPFFERHLRGQPAAQVAEATLFETGRNVWRRFDAWPPSGVDARSLHLLAGGRLAFDAPPEEEEAFDEFTSDPAAPVPYLDGEQLGMAKRYMIADQRFASGRADVLSWRSDPLEQAVTLAGPLFAELFVSTTREDADWVVKLIDVQPDDAPPEAAGDERLIRGEVIRGRFRDGYATPRPFVPGQPARVRLPLQDVLHTFLPGHRIMIQVQSSWFPLVDRNPQGWVDDIFQARAEHFVAATHRVWRDQTRASRIDVGVLDLEAAKGR